MTSPSTTMSSVSKRPWRGAPAQQSVAADQVPAAEPAVAALPRRAVTVGGGAEVHADRVRREERAPSRRAQPEREVEVLHVGEDRFVEPVGLLPCRAAVRGRGARGTREHRPLAACALEGHALKARKARERAVGDKPGAVDRLLSRLQHQRCHGADVRVLSEGSDEALEEVGPAVDVVVEQHDDFTRARGDPPVAGFGEAVVLVEMLEVDVGPSLAHPHARVVGGAVVHDDEPERHGLSTQVAQAIRGEVEAVVRDDHDVYRGRHSASSYLPPISATGEDAASLSRP